MRSFKTFISEQAPSLMKVSATDHNKNLRWLVVKDGKVTLTTSANIPLALTAVVDERKLPGKPSGTAKITAAAKEEILKAKNRKDLIQILNRITYYNWS